MKPSEKLQLQGASVGDGVARAGMRAARDANDPIDRFPTMTAQAVSNPERRMASRFRMRFAAELAIGTALVAMVRDLSIMECAMEIRTVDAGLLHLPAIGRDTCGNILPIALRNMRSEEQYLLYGLGFIPLLAHTKRASWTPYLGPPPGRAQRPGRHVCGGPDRNRPTVPAGRPHQRP